MRWATRRATLWSLTLKAIAIFALAPGILAILPACAPAGPALERFDARESRWVEFDPVAIDSMSIQREGSTVHVTSIFVNAENRVTLTFDIFLEPPARFVAGNQESEIGEETFRGPVSAESVEFFGGQNEGPSVGGVLVFENPAVGTRYRIRFPRTSRLP